LPPAAPDRTAFAAVIEAELAAYGELCKVLQDEQDSLQRGDVEALQQLTERKSTQIERLAGLGADRADFLTRMQLPATPAGMQTWLREHAGVHRDALADAWERLLATAQEARALNDLNGSLVALRLNHSQAALAALHQAGRQHVFYGPDGQSQFEPVARALGRA
jgi:flagella synthesis protein FlgN